MLKQTISYTDSNGTEREEDFYFNLTKTEMMALEHSMPGGYSEHLKQIAKAVTSKELFALVKTVVLISYGEKDVSGIKFVKKDKEGRSLSADFEQTFAYDELMFTLTTDADKALAFIQGCMPTIPQLPPTIPQLPPTS